MYYAGIGSRRTPTDYLRLMTRIAQRLSELKFILRSGGAEGADQAFEAGAKYKEIYTTANVEARALVMAEEYHPAWDRLGNYAKLLHARNCYQVLGKDLQTPAKFVICWTADGTERTTTISTGGTGQAIRIAVANNIPVFNLNNPNALNKLGELVRKP